MEALTGVSVALLTIWDMVKSAEKDAHGQYPVTGLKEFTWLRRKRVPDCALHLKKQAYTLIPPQSKFMGTRD